MSIIIKSDQKSSASIGNVFGLKSDIDFSIMLDFSRGDYRYRDDDGALNSITLDEAIDFSRSSKAETVNSFGEVIVVDAGVPRLQYNKETGARGLLIEKEVTNMLANPYTPVTQTLTIPKNSQARILVLSVRGTGSATLSGAVTTKNITQATDGNPQFALLPSSTVDPSVTVTVTGSLQVAQLELKESKDGGSYATSFVPQGLAARAAEKAVFSDFLAGRLANAKTVIMGYVLNKRVLGTLIPSSSSILFAIYNKAASPLDSSSTNYAGVRLEHNFSTTATDTVKLVAPTYFPNFGDQRVKSLAVSDSQTITVAATFDQGGVNITHSANGLSIDTFDAADEVVFDALELAPAAKLGGIITHVAVFDRKLTRAQIEKITTSWV